MRGQNRGADVEHGHVHTGGTHWEGRAASRASREQWGAAAQHGELSAVLCVGERGPRGVAGGGSRGRRCMYTRG